MKAKLVKESLNSDFNIKESPEKIVNKLIKLGYNVEYDSEYNIISVKQRGYDFISNDEDDNDKYSYYLTWWELEDGSVTYAISPDDIDDYMTVAEWGEPVYDSRTFIKILKDEYDKNLWM